MVANSHIFTFRFIQHAKQKYPESALNIGFFGFFVYCYIITNSLKGCKTLMKFLSITFSFKSMIP